MLNFQESREKNQYSVGSVQRCQALPHQAVAVFGAGSEEAQRQGFGTKGFYLSRKHDLLSLNLLELATRARPFKPPDTAR